MAEPQIGARIVVRGQEDVRASFARMAQDADASLSRVGSSLSRAGSVGTFAVETTLATAKAAFSAVSTSIGVVGNAVNTVTGLVGTAISSLNTLAGAFGAAGAVATVGVGGLLYAAKSYAQTVAENVSAADALADSVGLGVEELTRLQSVVRLAGGDGDKFGQALQSMNRKILDLAAGGEQAEEAFDQLGLSIENFRDKKGNLVGTRAQLDIVIDRLSKIKNPALQAKASMDILGKSGREIGSLFEEGSRGLREAEAEVGRYGTTVKRELADDMSEVLGQQLKLQESLKGLGLSFGRIFFPFFAESAEKTSDWLNNNRSMVEDYLQKTVDFIGEVKDDIVGLFTGEDDFNFTLFEKISGPLATLKDIALDVWDAIMGRGFGERIPEIKAFAETIEAAAAAAFRLAQLLAKALDLQDTSALEMLQGLKGALDAFVAGMDGLNAGGEYAWASNLGEAAVAASNALGVLVKLITENRNEITTFARDGLRLLTEGLSAIRSQVNGTPIEEGNTFAFLDVWMPRVQQAVEFITHWFNVLTVDFRRAIDHLVAIAGPAFQVLDTIGKMLGLGDGSEGSAGREFAILLALASLTGALHILAPMATIVAGLAATLAALVNVIPTVGAAFIAAGKVIAGVVGGLSAPWLAFFAFLTGVAYFSLGWIMDNWSDMVDGFRTIMDLMVSLGRLAWDGIKAVFGGMADFFKNPIEKIGNMFASLWGGIKNGASGAWNAVKRLFGGAPDKIEGSDGGSPEPSFDVGGIVPGAAGQARRAIVHGGERILTLGETSLFDQLMAGLGAMTGFQAQTAFAGGPLATPSRAPGAGLVGGGIDILGGAEGQFYANIQTWKQLKAAVQRNGLQVRTQRARS